MHPHKALKNRLADLLSDELGQYRHENGQIVPSIAVIPPVVPDEFNFVPESGIAAAIWKTPIEDVSSQGGAKMEGRYWRVFLAQRDMDESIHRTTNLIKKVFTGAVGTTAAQEKTREQIKFERAIIKIPEWDDFDGDWIKGQVAYYRARSS